MSKVLRILDLLGQDAGLQRADSEELAQALAGMELDHGTMTALLSGDSVALTKMLGASSNVVCGLFPGKEEEEEENEESPDQDDEERAPDREDDPNVSIRQIAVHANIR